LCSRLKQIFISQNVVWDIIFPKQSCVVAGEINKHLILSASANQIESYWLLPLFTQTTGHEYQGTICNTACPAMASKLLKAFNTVNLLIEMQMLSYWYFVQHVTTYEIFIIVCTLSLRILNTWALMLVLNWTVFRRDCRVLLEGRGNRDQRNV